LLDQRKQLLDQKEARLRAEAERLGVLRQEVEKLIAQHEQKVAATAAAKEAARRERAKAEEEARQARLVQLTKIYETMAPEEAALRIEQLPRDLAVQVLSRLKSKTASAILAQVKPAKAAKLTEALVAQAEVSR
jgi:flagellar motility protein MotE (MotC chaperone)